MNWYVETSLLEIRDLLATLAEKKGLTCGIRTYNNFIGIGLEGSKMVYFSPNSNFRNYSGWYKVSLEEAIKKLKNVEEITTILGYKACLQKGSVSIGCQTISVDTIEEIIRRIENPIIVNSANVYIDTIFELFKIQIIKDGPIDNKGIIFRGQKVPIKFIKETLLKIKETK